MKITVHGVDISSFLLTDSFLLDRYGANRSSFSFALAVFSDSGKSSPVIEAGMEVKLYGDEETVVWGGVVDRLSVFKRSGRLREFRVSCYGYEQILYRLAIEPFYAKAANVGRAAQVLFTRYLLPEGLKASAGNFSMSGTITEYASGKWKMLFRVFDELADLYGHCWWVDQQKNFFFRDSMPATETGNRLRPDGQSTFSYCDLVFRKKIGSYRNCQVASDRGMVFGVAENAAEIAKMEPYLGTGKYYGIMESSHIESAAQAAGMAENLLQKAEGMPESVQFCSDDYCPALFEILRVQGAEYGYPNLTRFFISRVQSRFSEGKWTHRILAERMTAGIIHPARIKELHFYEEN